MAMPERLIDGHAANWVDRGQPPEPELTRVLAHYLDQRAQLAGETLRPHVTALRGMVEAESTEVHLLGYLREIEREFGVTDSEDRGRRRRAVVIALWHIAKCAEVRDRAARLMAHGAPPTRVPPADARRGGAAT
jgi:hypothetical protein